MQLICTSLLSYGYNITKQLKYQNTLHRQYPNVSSVKIVKQFKQHFLDIQRHLIKSWLVGLWFYVPVNNFSVMLRRILIKRNFTLSIYVNNQRANSLHTYNLIGTFVVHCLDLFFYLKFQNCKGPCKSKMVLIHID